MQKQLLNANSPLDEWLSYLEQQHYKSIDLGLERISQVAKQLDLLTPAPFVITVGGTNGKGTTCRLLERMLSATGLKVGVYSSPHLIRYNERVRINEKELEDSSHTQSFAFIEQHKSASLTYFEFSTLSALYLFKQAKLDVVILEVGLGGRLDATNIVDADIAVITSIDIDHIDFLGNDRETIGLEKAGIFRANKPVIIGDPQPPQAMLDYAEKLNCIVACRNQDWYFTQQEQDWSWQSKTYHLTGLPFSQIPLANAATVLATLAYLPISIKEEVIKKSLQEVSLTGRFQFLTDLEKQRLSHQLNISVLPQIILDVGHNPHATNYLASRLAMLKQQNPNSKIVAICGILQDKDSKGILAPLLDYLDACYCLDLQGPRGQQGTALQAIVNNLSHNKLPCQSVHSMHEGLKIALAGMQQQDYLLIFGSFYTVTELLLLI